MSWIGLMWLRIGTSGGLLWTRYLIYWLAVQLTAPQEGLSSWVCKYMHVLQLLWSSFRETGLSDIRNNEGLLYSDTLINHHGMSLKQLITWRYLH
jgi:hypothetical protein